ncbi:single-stranded DNA-binding protein [Flaviflexus salsibiostraticola]|uniref:Single-stranded DNA-binding protein n=1 Tax=Flaviflexus salsibiostraticola TaxID=1282737 RepID=A0A3Q8WTS6_9ACTO|nr:single-stranded DNA-binding protein [Flaviflexus salsibiostraticola]AZN29784.1 single-stranded DNA-binding protein [Flaviflexus salsibiostraticola]
MNNEINVSVMGFAGADAALIENEGKKPYAYFRVGSTSWRGVGEAREQFTEWFTVRTYGELARNCAMSVQKGIPLLIRGRLETDTYQAKDDPAQTRKDLIIRADSVGVEIGRGTVAYTRNPPAAEESAQF